MRTPTHRAGVACIAAATILLPFGHAEARTATPATLADAFALVRPGETLTLLAGSYGAINLPRRTFGKPLIIDASRATFTQVTMRNLRGIDLRGGRVVGPRLQASGVIIDEAKNVRVSGMTITGPRVGVTISRSTGVHVIGNVFDGVRSDGVNVTMATYVNIHDNICRNFRPIMPTYASNGRLLIDGDHPDCVQGWTTPGSRPTTDISIVGNVGTGYMQGVYFRNPYGGRLRRITVRDNTMTVSAWNGIVIQDVDGVSITNNVVRTVPGARALNFPFQLIRTWLRVAGSGVVFCGNQAPDDPEAQGTRRC